MIKCYLIDDHQMFLDGIKAFLESKNTIEIVGCSNSAEHALNKLSGIVVDLIVTDYNLPKMKGSDLVKSLKKSIPTVKIIALSMHHEKHIVEGILKAGADSYVLKSSSHQELQDAIDKTMKGEVFVSPQITKMLVDTIKYPSILDQLSNREVEIIRLIADEHTNRQIAEKLFISEKTVETHKRNIFRKTSSNSGIGLTKFAIAHNLI